MNRFEEILNEMFKPDAECPLWCSIAISGDKDTHLEAMRQAYNLALRDAAESARLEPDGMMLQVDKQSILSLKINNNE